MSGVGMDFGAHDFSLLDDWQNASLELLHFGGPAPIRANTDFENHKH